MLDIPDFEHIVNEWEEAMHSLPSYATFKEGSAALPGLNLVISSTDVM